MILNFGLVLGCKAEIFLCSFHKTFLNHGSQFSVSISAGKEGMRGGGPNNRLPDLLLGEGSRIPDLLERIPDLISFPLTVLSIVWFLQKQTKKFDPKIPHLLFPTSKTLLTYPTAHFKIMGYSQG